MSCTTTKKLRAPAQVWKRFHSLEISATFFIGKTKLVKRNYITAVVPSTGFKRFVNPFRRVRTEELLHKPTLTEEQIFVIKARILKETLPAGDNDNRGPVPQPHSDNGISGPTC